MHMGWNTAEALLGGGAAITQETITRFFSLHLAFSLIPLILVELYFYKNAYTRIPLSWLKRSIIILMLVASGRCFAGCARAQIKSGCDAVAYFVRLVFSWPLSDV